MQAAVAYRPILFFQKRSQKPLSAVWIDFLRETTTRSPSFFEEISTELGGGIGYDKTGCGYGYGVH